MPKGNAPKKARQRAILELMNQGINSPTEIQARLKSDYGIDTTRQTIYRDIASGVEPVTESIVEEHKASMIKNLMELEEVAYNNGIKGDTKAMDTYTKLVKTRADILKKIVEIQAELNRTERPIYEVHIGEFKEAKKKDKEEKNDGKSETADN